MSQILQKYVSWNFFCKGRKKKRETSSSFFCFLEYKKNLLCLFYITVPLTAFAQEDYLTAMTTLQNCTSRKNKRITCSSNVTLRVVWTFYYIFVFFFWGGGGNLNLKYTDNNCVDENLVITKTMLTAPGCVRKKYL